jgi:hypothetical protein
MVTKYRRCRPLPPQLGHSPLAQVDKIPLKRPVPLQIRHLRNGVSQTDTSHTRKPTATVITAPVPASCVRPALAKNTIANRNTHPMTVIVIPAAGNCNGRYDRLVVSFEPSAFRAIMLSDTALTRRSPGWDKRSSTAEVIASYGNRLVHSAGQAVPLVHPVPLVPHSPSGVLPLNGIDGALMLLPRHRWGIDAATGGRVGWPAGSPGRMRRPGPARPQPPPWKSLDLTVVSSGLTVVSAGRPRRPGRPRSSGRLRPRPAARAGRAGPRRPRRTRRPARASSGRAASR